MEKKKKVASLASGSELSGNESSSKSGGKKAKLSLQRKESGKTTLVVPAVDLNETEDFKDCRSFAKKPAVKGGRSKTQAKEVLKRKERSKREREGAGSETDLKDANGATKSFRSKLGRQVEGADDVAPVTNKDDVGIKTIKEDNSDEDCIDGKIYVRRTYGKGEPKRIADDESENIMITLNKVMSRSSKFEREMNTGNVSAKRETKGNLPEQSTIGKSLSSRFGRAEKQKLQHGGSATEIHQAGQSTSQDAGDFHPSTSDKGEDLMELPPKIRQCPTCQIHLPREIFVEHLKDCLENFEKNVEEKRKKVQKESVLKEKQRKKQQEESAFGISLSEDHDEDSDYLCQICQTDLSPLDAVARAEHVNNCIDQVESKKTGPVQPPVRSGVPDCPMCGKPLKTEASRKVHLKKCARTLGVTTDQMMTALKAQEKEAHLGTGSVAQGTAQAKKATTATTRRKKKKLPTDETTQLAMALSSSLADEQQKREKALIGQLNLRGIGDMDKLSAPDGKKSRKKKGAAGAPPLLLQLTKEESHSRVAQRVTQYIESHIQDNEITSTPPLSRESCLDDLPGTKMVDYTAVKEKCKEQLWGLTSLEDHTQPRSFFYTSALMPPVTMSRVPPGSKLRRLSQIPGRRKSEEEKGDAENQPTSDMEDDNPATPIIASTPTALVLAELAGEGDAHSQKGDAHSQQGDSTSQQNFRPSELRAAEGDILPQATTSIRGLSTSEKDSEDCDVLIRQVMNCNSETNAIDVETDDFVKKQADSKTELKGSNSDREVRTRSGRDQELSQREVTNSRNHESALCDDPNHVSMETGVNVEDDDDVLEQASGFCVEEVFEVKDDDSSERLKLIQNDYLSLVDNPSHSDVTLETCDNCCIHAHRVILMLRCPALLELTETRVISLPNSSREAVLSLLKFVYAGKVQVQHSSLSDVHALAARFGVEELEHHCESALKDIKTDADPDVESVEQADRERRESIDDMFKELLSDDDFNMAADPQEEEEKDLKKNQSDDDEDDWREIYLSQRQQLQRRKSFEDEQRTSAEREKTSDQETGIRRDQDMEVEEGCRPLLEDEDSDMLEDCNVSEEAVGRNHGRSVEPSDGSDEKEEEIHSRATCGTRSRRFTGQNYKQTRRPSKKNDVEDTSRNGSGDGANKHAKEDRQKEVIQSNLKDVEEEEEEEYLDDEMLISRSRIRDRSSKQTEHTDRQKEVVARYMKEMKDEEEEEELDVGKMTCGEEELFPSEDELMSQNLHLALDSSEQEEGMEEESQKSDDIAGSMNLQSKMKTGNNAESASLVSNSRGSRKGQSKYKSESGHGKDDSSCKREFIKERSDSVQEHESDSESGSKRQSDDFVIIKSGTSTSDSCANDVPEGSKDLLPSFEEPNEGNKNQDSSEISDVEVIDSSRLKTSEPTKRKRTPSGSDVLNSVFRKSSTSFETPREKSSRKRVKLGTPSTEQNRDNKANFNKMSTPVDRSSVSTSRSSVVAEDSLYITPIPKERQRSTFMFATPDSPNENQMATGAGDFVAIPVGRIVLTEEGQEGILPLQKEEMGGSIKFSSLPMDKNRKKARGRRETKVESERLTDNPTSSDSDDKDTRKMESNTLPNRRVGARQRHSETEDENKRKRDKESMLVTDRPASDERGDGYGDIRKKLLAQVRGQIAVLQSEEEASDRGDLRKDRPSDGSDDDADVSPVFPMADFSCFSESVSRPVVSHLSDSSMKVGLAGIGDSGHKQTPSKDRDALKPSGCATDSDSDVEITSDNLQLVAELSNSISPKFKSISCLKKISSERSSRRLSLNTSRSSSHSAEADVPADGDGDVDVPADAGPLVEEDSPTAQESPLAPGDVWEGFDDIDADYMYEPFCDADTEESPKKKEPQIQGSAQKKKYTHRRRISLDDSAARSSVGHATSPQRRSHDDQQPTSLEEDGKLPSPEKADQGEVTIEFEVPGGDSFLWHEENDPAEEIGAGEQEVEEEQEEEEQSTGTTTFKTPVSRQPVKKSKKWVPPSPFTPMPNYDTMNTPQLKKAVTKYGVRPVGKKRMKILLKDIYQQTHQYETDSDYDQNSPLKKITANNKPDLAKQKSSKPSTKSSLTATETSSKPVRKIAQHSKSSVQTSKSSGPSSKPSVQTSNSSVPSRHVSTRIPSAASSDTSASEDGSSNRSVSSSQDSGRSDVPEESFLHEEEEEENLSASQKGNQVDFNAMMLQFVRKRPDIHTRMMMYEPLELDWLKKEVQDSGIKCSTQKLMDFLDEKCLTFTMKNMTKRNANRRKPKKRRKIDVPV